MTDINRFSSRPQRLDLAFLDAADVVVSKHVRETALKERWNEAPAEVEALLHRERYPQTP